MCTLRAVAKHCTESFGFNGISTPESCPIQFNIIDLSWMKTRFAIGVSQQCLLRRLTGSSDPRIVAIVVECYGTNKSIHAIRPADLRQRLEHNNASTFTSHVAIGCRIKRFAAPIW